MVGSSNVLGFHWKILPNFPFTLSFFNSIQPLVKTAIHSDKDEIYWLGCMDQLLENCWNSSLMCSFSPIQGTKPWLVLKFHVSWTLRSWLHEISALIMTLSPGLEKNYTLEWSSNSFPGMTSMSGCLENCQKYIPKSQCSPIQETRS